MHGTKLLRDTDVYNWVLPALLALTVVFCARCGGVEAVEQIPTGTDVVVTLEDGTVVQGQLMNVEPDTLLVERPGNGRQQSIARSMVAEVKRADDEGSMISSLFSREPDFDDIVVPAGTVITATLETPVASNTSQVEDPVRAVVQSAVAVDGREVIPRGSALTGSVHTADASGKVKGVARLAFGFDRLSAGSTTYDIDTKTLAYQANATKSDDATKIGAGAVAGTIIGGLAGGKKGAAVGAAVGGGAGTAVVLATPGEEISLRSGRELRIELTSAITVRVPHRSS
jgi:hypothetical protein